MAKHTVNDRAVDFALELIAKRDGTKARYGFVFGDFRRIHRMGIISCHYRAAEWRHKEIELAAHDLLQALDNA